MWQFAVEEVPGVKFLKDLTDTQYANCLAAVHRTIEHNKKEMARNISVVQASVVSRTVRAMTSTGTSENSIMESVVARYSGGTRDLCF